MTTQQPNSAERIRPHSRALGFVDIHRPEPNASRLDKAAWFGLQDFLGRYEYYEPTSVVTSLVKSTLERVAPDISAEVIVVHGPKDVAAAMPGYIIVSDARLASLTIRTHPQTGKIVLDVGQLEALLAHEAKHIRNNDFENGEEGVLAKIGKVRRDEILADFIPVLETLDKEGLNPHGMIRLLDTLDREDEEDRKSRKYSVTSPTHGSAIDRRLNLEDTFAFIDIRNLSEDVKEIELGPHDLESYVSDNLLSLRLEELPLIEQRYFLQRQFYKISGERILFGGLDMQSEAMKKSRVERLEHLRQLQRELFIHATQEMSPGTSLENAARQADDLTHILEYTLYNSGLEDGVSSQGREDLPQWSGHFTTPEEIIKFFFLGESPLFEYLGIQPPTPYRWEGSGEKIYLETHFDKLGKMVLYSYLTKQQTIDVPAYIEFLYQLNIHRGAESLYYEPLIEVLLERNALSPDTSRLIAKELADIPIHCESMLQYASHRDRQGAENMIFATERERFALLSGETPKSEVRTYIIEGIAKEIDRIRFARLSQITDPMEYLQFLHTHGVPFEQDKYSRQGTTVSQLEERFRLNYPLSKLIQRLQAWSRETGVTNLEGQEFLRIGMPGSSILDIYSISNLTNNGSERLSTTEAKDWMLLQVIINGPKTLLSQLTEDYGGERGERNTALDYVLQSFPKGVEGISAFVAAIQNATLRARSLGFVCEGDITKKDLRQITPLLQAAREQYMRKALKENDPQIIVDLINMLPIYGIGGDRETQVLWDRSARMVLGKIHSRLTSSGRRGPIQLSLLTDTELRQVFALGCLSQNNQIILRVAKEAVRDLVNRPTTSFTQAMDIVFREYAHLPKHILIGALQEIIEHKAKPLMEFEQLEQAVRNQLDDFLQETTVIGEAALVDAMIDPTRRFSGRRGLEPTLLFEAMINTGVSDKQLKEYLMTRWLEFYRLWFGPEESEAKIFDMETPLLTYGYEHKMHLLRRWVEELPPRFTPLAEIVESMYRLDPVVKYGLLRKVLVGDGSVLGTDKGKQRILELFLRERMDLSQNADTSDTFRILFQTMLDILPQQDLYSQLNQLFMALILQMPQNPCEYEQLAQEEANKILERLTPPTDEADRKRRIASGQKKFFQFVSQVALVRPSLVKKLTGLMRGTLNPRVRVTTRSETALLDILPSNDVTLGTGKFSAWELFLTAAENGGEFWAKLGQFAPLYFTPPSHLENRIMDLHDNRQGQSLLQAYRTLKREAEQPTDEGERLREYMGRIKEFGPRIGGGSVVTVIKVVLDNGQEEALTFLNPNMEYHLGRTVRMAKGTLAEAEALYSGNMIFPLLSVLVGEIDQVIRREAVAPDFPINDKRLAHGMEQFNSEEARRGGKYRMIVPRTKDDPFNKWIPGKDIVVNGVNIGRLEIVADSEQTNIAQGKITQKDMQEVVGTLVRSYMYQLLILGLAHADMHAFNFAVTKANTGIGMFDRRDLISLSEPDQSLIKHLVTAIGTGQDITGIFVGYLFTWPQNQHHPLSQNQVVRELQEGFQVTSDTGSALASRVTQTILELHKRHVFVPTYIEQIGRNLQLLNQLAQKAGLTGITDVAGPYILELFTQGRL